MCNVFFFKYDTVVYVLWPDFDILKKLDPVAVYYKIFLIVDVPFVVKQQTHFKSFIVFFYYNGDMYVFL